MHNTTIITKSGEIYNGPIWVWRPQENWFSILWENNEEVFSFDDVKSVITYGERMSINKIGDQDELQRARKMLARGRKYRWKGYPSEKFQWE